MAEGTSRRELISRAGILAGAAGAIGIAGAGVAPAGASTAASAATSSGSRTASATLPRVIRGIDWRLVWPGVAPGTRPHRGAAALPTGRLTDASGAVIGRFECSTLPTSGAGTHLHQLHLDDGTVTAVGPSTMGDATFAVLGGTGRYAGITGTYRVRQQPAAHRGSATFELDVTSQGSQR